MHFKPAARILSLSASMALLSILVAATLAGLAGPAAATYRIVAFGDSLTAGYELAPGDSFPEQLEARLREAGQDVCVVNAGVSGDTTSGGLARLDWSVGEDAALVIVELGANDALRGVDPQIVRANISALIAQLQARGIEIVLAGMLSPPNMGPEYAEQFNAIYPDLAREHDVALLPFFLDGVAGDPALLLADGMHPNAQGVGRIVDNILPLILERLERSGKSG